MRTPTPNFERKAPQTKTRLGVVTAARQGLSAFQNLLTQLFERDKDDQKERVEHSHFEMS